MVISTQTWYASMNGGAYGRLHCLEEPVRCGFPASTEESLDKDVAQLKTRDGYVRLFFAGSPKPGSLDRNGISTFAYVLVPAGEVDWRRSFCGDDTGRVCYRLDGAMPRVVGGRCPDPCDELK